ncbi:SGNH/GDSL hydrolase family protein [Acinetobacter baumannii]
MPILTSEMFENLHRDFIDTGKAINIIGIISPRYGEPFKSLPLVSKEAENRGGYISAPTLTALQAIVPSYNWQLARDDSTGDEYRWNPAASPNPKWEPTGRNYLKDAKSFAENAAVSAPKSVKSYGYYTGTETNSLLSSDGPSAYAVQVPEAGYVKKFKTQLAGGSAKVRIQLYRPSDMGAKLIESREYTVPFPNSEVSLIDNPIRVEKNDLVTLAWISGTYVRGKAITTGDPLGNIVVTQTLTVGNEVAVARTRNKLEFAIDVLTDSVPSLKPDLTANLGLGYSVAPTLTTTVAGALNTPTTTGDITWAYGEITTPITISKLKQLRYTTRSISRDVLFRLCVLSPNADGSYKIDLVKWVSAPADANGVVTANSTHYGEILIPKGGYVLVNGTTTIDSPLAQATGLPNRPLPYINASLIQTGATVSLQINPSTPPLSLEVTYESASNNLDNRVTALENNALQVTLPVYSTVLDSQIFSGSTIPERWSAPNWTIDDTGLQSPATGGWNVNALSTGFSALANREYRQEFTVADINSVFGFCTAPIEANSGAAVALVDGSNKKLHIMLWDGSATAGTSVASVDMQPLVANTPYILSVEKRGYFSTVKLINKVTGQTNTVEYSGTNPYVQFHGRAGFTFISGSVKFKNYRFTAFYPRELHFIIEGDSNSERAANVLPNKTWAFMLADMRRMNADAIVGGRSGDETPNFLKRKEYDLMAWRPKYVIWALGTNDTSQATWRTNMQQNIADTLAIGAEPILVTQIPRNDSQALRTAMNDDIRNGYFGPYRYIEFAKAVSLNNDGVTWDPIYDSGDHIHVNPAGQQRLLQQVLIDMPELLR